MRAPGIELALAGMLVTLAAPASGEVLEDGAYGRLRGDLVLSVEVVPHAAWHGGAAYAGLSAALRARYLDMAGLVAGYDARLAGGRDDALWAAVDFRPAYLARFGLDLEHGPRWLDLMLDSLGLDVGVAWLRPGAGPGAGLALALGAGVELPLVWSQGHGLMLRLSGRTFVSQDGDVLGPGAAGNVYELGAGLVLRTLVRTGLAGGR